MQITPINSSFCKIQYKNLKQQKNEKISSIDNLNLDKINQSTNGIAFYGLFGTRKKQEINQNNAEQSLKSKQNWKDWETFYKVFNNLFGTRSREEMYNAASPLSNASEERAKEARNFCIQQYRHWYIPQLYLEPGRYSPSVFYKNLCARELSAVPDIMQGIGVEDNYRQQRFYSLMLDDIYVFLNEYKSRDDYSNELCNLYKEIESKYYEVGGDKIYRNINDINLNESPDSVKFGKGYILPDPKVLNTPENVLKAMDNDILKSSGGEIWNQNGSIVSSIADIVLTDDNRESYSKMSEALRRLQMIDYDKKDSYGISVLEKAMNAENHQLLGLIDGEGQGFTYYPELETAYNNIFDKTFKNKLNNLTIYFKDILQAIDSNSLKAVKAVMPQFNSVFMNAQAKSIIHAHLAYAKNPKIKKIVKAALV